MKKILLSLAITAMSIFANAQMAQFKAIYIYSFANYIDWKSASLSDNEFVITVVGDNEMAAELARMAKNKKIMERNVVVKEAATAKDVENSNIVYLGTSKATQITTLCQHCSADKLLIVSGKQGQCKYGADIAFVAADGKLKFEISPNNIKKRGLSVSNKLVNLGVNAD